MVRRRVMLTFSGDISKEPIIYNLGQQFKVVTNIRRADVAENTGWIILEMEGLENDVEQGIAWIISRGVRVAPADEDIAEV